MILSARDRRSIVKLLNVSEAARALGVPIRQMHSAIKGGKLPKPEIRLGKSLYYHADDLKEIAERYEAIKNHP
jgi:helix-turn-helix protein